MCRTAEGRGSDDFDSMRRLTRKATKQSAAGRASHLDGAPRRRSKELAAHVGWQVVKGALGLVGAALIGVFLRAPVEYDLLPPLIRWFGHTQALYLYGQAGTEPDDQYDLLIPGSYVASGRMIQMKEVAEREKNAPRNFIVQGERSGNLLAFVCLSSSTKVGLGSFAGQRLDRDEDIYLGTLTGLGHSTEGECKVITYRAVLGP
jgi:hypothetical protein